MTNVLVFSSNLGGFYGAGSAKFAYDKCGAIWGCGIGLQGNSYAIPTKDEFLDVMSIKRITIHVDNFIDFVHSRPDLIFNIVAIGCGLAGFKPEQIAPMFKNTPSNCVLPKEFIDVLEAI